MTVKRLIAILEKFDPDTRVYIGGLEGGVNDVSKVAKCRVVRNTSNKWYYGQHSYSLDHTKGKPGIEFQGKNNRSKP